MFSLLWAQNVQPVSKDAFVVPCGHVRLQLVSWNGIAVFERCRDSIAVFKLQELRVPFQTAWFFPCIFSLLTAAWWGSEVLLPEKVTPPGWVQSENDSPAVQKYGCHEIS